MLKFLKNLLSSSEIIGIDLGTTNSVVAVLEDGKPRVIESPDGGRIMPSVVGYAKDGSVLVGTPAVNQLATNPAKTIYSAKRFIGRDFETVKKNGAAWSVPFIVRPNYDEKSAAFELDGRMVSPEEIGAEVLRKLKLTAEAYLGKTVSKAVITVPAYFNDRQRQATADAAKIAGLEVAALINEPTAAALAYGQELDEEQTVGVYDLGGGTYDFSILKIKGEEGIFEVLATGGNPNLGGDNFDELIMQRVLASFAQETGVDLSKDRQALARVKESVVKAKVQLSSQNEAVVTIPFLVNGPSGPLHLEHTITRADFESMIRPMLESTVADMKKALEESGLKPSDLDHILLVGGSTRIPLVKDLIKKFHGREPLQNHGVDEIVALGAAIHGGIVRGDIEAELYDVTSLSLGLQEVGDVMSILIKKDSRVPVTATGDFSTVVENQTSALLNIYQGEAKKASENHLLGSILIEEIEPRPAGVPRITVTYTINGDGVLEVSAKDDKGREQKVTLKNAGRLERREIKRMQKEASLPQDVRKLLNSARAELSQEIKRVEETAVASRDKDSARNMLVKVEEAEKVLQESIDADDLAHTIKEVRRLS
jgi:molecular chaperone DnaK